MRLGIAIRNFSTNQLACDFVEAANTFLKDNFKSDIVGFYEEEGFYTLEPNFSCMHLNELWGFHYPVFATSLNIAADLIKNPSPTKKFFYVYDLEWLYFEQKDFGRLAEIYRHPELEIICRSESHKKLFSNCWNRPVSHVLKGFNIYEMVRISYGRNDLEKNVH